MRTCLAIKLLLVGETRGPNTGPAVVIKLYEAAEVDRVLARTRLLVNVLDAEPRAKVG